MKIACLNILHFYGTTAFKLNSVYCTGDNNVLLQQTSNWLLSFRDGQEIISPLGSVSFLKNKSNLLRRTLPVTATFIGQLENQLIVFEKLICHLIDATRAEFNRQSAISGGSKFHVS